MRPGRQAPSAESPSRSRAEPLGRSALLGIGTAAVGGLQAVLEGLVVARPRQGDLCTVIVANAALTFFYPGDVVIRLRSAQAEPFTSGPLTGHEESVGLRGRPWP